MALEPRQDFKPSQSRHFQIEEDDRRNGKQIAIGKLVFSFEISEGLFAVGRERDVHLGPEFGQFSLDKELVVWSSSITRIVSRMSQKMSTAVLSCKWENVATQALARGKQLLGLGIDIETESQYKLRPMNSMYRNRLGFWLVLPVALALTIELRGDERRFGIL